MITSGAANAALSGRDGATRAPVRCSVMLGSHRRLIGSRDPLAAAATVEWSAPARGKRRDQRTDRHHDERERYARGHHPFDPYGMVFCASAASGAAKNRSARTVTILGIVVSATVTRAVSVLDLSLDLPSPHSPAAGRASLADRWNALLGGRLLLN